MQIVAVLVLGAVVGASGRYLFERRLSGDGIIVTLIGVVGAIVASVLARQIVGPQHNVAALFGGLVGAMALVSLYWATGSADGQTLKRR